MSRWSEKLLVRRIVARDHEACARLVRLHQAPVYRLLVRLCRDAHLAEDLTQETFAAAWEGIEGFRGSSALGTWLHRIAYRRFLDARRRRTRVAPAEPHEAIDQAPSRGPDPLEEVLADERSRRLHRALDMLDPAERDVLVLHYLQGLSLRETAAVLDEPTGTVKWRTSQALERLRALMGRRSNHETKTTTGPGAAEPKITSQSATLAANAPDP